MCDLTCREETINYQARSHEFSFTLTPYTSSKSLSFAEAKKTLVVTYKSTTLQYDAGGATTTGLDALGVRDGSPVVPVASSTDKRLSLDVEGIVVLPDGSYVFSFSSSTSFCNQPRSAQVVDQRRIRTLHLQILFLRRASPSHSAPRCCSTIQ